MRRTYQNFKVGADGVFPSPLESGDNGESFGCLVGLISH